MSDPSSQHHHQIQSHWGF